MNEKSVSRDPASREVVLGQAPGRGRRLLLRPLASDDDYARCEALQRATWGQDFVQIASATMMMISQKMGGIAAGAFDDDGELVGLVFGITGLRHGRPAHWSHILAVVPELHGHGLGRALKLYQKDRLLEIGVERMYWTYDPLESRNAHLNLNRLRAEPVEYLRDLYGDGSSNVLHRGLGTDRFLVEWRLDDEAVDRSIEPKATSSADSETTEIAIIMPRVNVDDQGRPLTDTLRLPDLNTLLVEIPTDIQRLKTEDPELAVAWRTSTRQALQHYMDAGHRVRRLLRDGRRCAYLLEKKRR